MKKRNNWPAIIALLLLLTTLTVNITAQKKSPVKNNAVPNIMKNTIDTPRYVPAVKIPTHVLASLDSITTVIMPQFGKSMSVDDAEQYKQFYNRQISRIIRAAIKDSIKVTSK